MTFLRTRIIPAVVVALIAGMAAFVFWPEPAATWLRVDAPTAIVTNQPFTATVTLLEPVDHAFLDFDLHGQDARKQPLRCVAASRSQAVSTEARSFTFTLVLPDRQDVARVHAVIYLSRTGQWSDALRVARSEPIDVIREAPDPKNSEVRPWVVHDQKEDPVIEVPNPPIARAIVTALWLAGACVATLNWRRAIPPHGPPLLAGLLLTIAIWEATTAGVWIESAGRWLAQAAGLYEDRRHFQQVVTLVAVCAICTLAAVGLRRRRRRIPALAMAGIAVYGTVELAGMPSLHEIDHILAFSIGPLPVAVLARAVGACLAVAGTVARLRAQDSHVTAG